MYFSSRVEQVKFVDFCGKYRLPLLQYLCSPHCSPDTPCSRSPCGSRAPPTPPPAAAHAAAADPSPRQASPDLDDQAAARRMRRVLLG